MTRDEISKLMQAQPKHINGMNLPAVLPRTMSVEITVGQFDTVACLVYLNQSIAIGVARRHPSDRRNDQLGVSIALGRMFTKAAGLYADKALLLTQPQVPAPDEELVQALRRANRAEAVKAKNERRREARERFFAKCLELHQEPAHYYEDAQEWRGKVFGDWHGHA